MTIASEIRTQLEWTGPNSKRLGHIVLTREQAEEVLREMMDAPDSPMARIEKKIDELIETIQLLGLRR